MSAKYSTELSVCPFVAERATDKLAEANAGNVAPLAGAVTAGTGGEAICASCAGASAWLKNCTSSSRPLKQRAPLVGSWPM